MDKLNQMKFNCKYGDLSQIASDIEMFYQFCFTSLHRASCDEKGIANYNTSRYNELAAVSILINDVMYSQYFDENEISTITKEIESEMNLLKPLLENNNRKGASSVDTRIELLKNINK